MNKNHTEHYQRFAHSIQTLYSTMNTTFTNSVTVIVVIIQNSIYRVSQEEWTKLREGVPYVKVYRYNPEHLYPKLNGYGDNGKRSLKL